MFELDDEARWILGRPNFWCSGVAARLRTLGRAINHRAEDEQAEVIHWMLGLYLDHGAGWREAGAKILAGPPPRRAWDEADPERPDRPETRGLANPTIL